MPWPWKKELTPLYGLLANPPPSIGTDVMHPDLALLFQTFAKMGPVIDEIIKVLEAAVPATQISPLIQGIEDAVTRLNAAIAAHKAPPQ